MTTRTSNKFLNMCIAALSGLMVAACQADTIDPNTADGFVQINRKIQCSLNDEEDIVYRWSGRAYSRVPGERDKHIFNLEGMNIRQCTSVEDPVRGTGYRMVSREIMLYLDPKTSDIIDTWENPWTGATNEVIHVANDPVNMRPSFGKNAEGEVTPFHLDEINGTYMLKFEVPLFYRNPLAGDYQQYVGNDYHATEIFDFNGQVDELLDPNQDTAYPVVSWVRIADWLPWMEMRSRAGLLYFNAMGRKLQSYEQLPDIMKDAIAERFPKYTEAPPTDDARPNETSWTYMKKIIDKRRAESGEAPAKSSGH